MTIARKFTDGILPGALEYREGDIGYQTASGIWATQRTFSGTETAIAYAGFAVALAQRSEFKLVMIDELGIMDAKTKAKLLGRMVALEKEGVINQGVFCDVAVTDVKGVTLIKV